MVRFLLFLPSGFRGTAASCPQDTFPVPTTHTILLHRRLSRIVSCRPPPPRAAATPAAAAVIAPARAAAAPGAAAIHSAATSTEQI